MKTIELKNIISDRIRNRDYYGAFEIIDKESEVYLNGENVDFSFCIELMIQNQDLYEYMGASKQYEMAFELLNKLIRNRNRLFISCLNSDRPELKLLFKRFVGDYSSDY